MCTLFSFYHNVYLAPFYPESVTISLVWDSEFWRGVWQRFAKRRTQATHNLCSNEHADETTTRNSPSMMDTLTLVGKGKKVLNYP
jgi:hypothetical protein